jgi:lysophospholipase L1-like esterase
LGDSITQQCRWFIPLLERLYPAYPGRVSLLNAGISGNSLTLDTDPGFKGIFGDAGAKRMESDCFSDHGVKKMLLALGTNDVLQAETFLCKQSIPSPDAFDEACKQVSGAAHSRGAKVSAISIFPVKFGKKDNEKRERLRQQFNEILRSSFDSYIDADKILQGTQGYKEGYSVPDHVHLSKLGGKALADGIDLDELMDLRHEG